MRLDRGQDLSRVRSSNHRPFDDALSLAEHLGRTAVGDLCDRCSRCSDFRGRRASTYDCAAKQGPLEKLATLHGESLQFSIPETRMMYSGLGDTASHAVLSQPE